MIKVKNSITKTNELANKLQKIIKVSKKISYKNYESEKINSIPFSLFENNNNNFIFQSEFDDLYSNLKYDNKNQELDLKERLSSLKIDSNEGSDLGVKKRTSSILSLLEMNFSKKRPHKLDKSS